MSFNYLILIWFDENKRNLPWRETNDPYPIWISEIILQQTRVVQGWDYYVRFLERFPTVQELAKSDEQEILKLWQGLGYYSRARNLYETAKHIVVNCHGKFPTDFNALKKLKGVGDYTAAAIASISFNQAVPAIDGNAMRVYARYFNLSLDISDHKTKKYFFDLGLEIMDKKRPGDYNQAVMELGALICLPKNPKCEICPVNDSCEGLIQNKVAELPLSSKKIKVKNRNFNYLEISDGRNYLIKQRTENDVWKNLYDFPMIETKDGQDFETEFKSIDTKKIPEKVHHEKHLLSHQRLIITFWRISAKDKEMEWYKKKFEAIQVSSEEIHLLPLPKPMEKYVNHKIQM